MEKMEVDEVVVDLSVSAPRPPTIPIPPSITIEPSYPSLHVNNSSSGGSGGGSVGIGLGASTTTATITNNRRVLRPRLERSYVESPDVLINGSLDKEKPRTNGNAAGGYSSDSSEGEMPPLAPIKELSPSELRQRERGLRRLREELRAEEMKLVLLKKLKQSQALKENVAVLPPSIPQSALPPTGLPSGLSITPTTVKVPSKTQVPQAAHTRPTTGSAHKPGQMNASGVRGQPPQLSRPGLHGTTISNSPVSSRGTNLSVPQPQSRNLGRSSGFPPGVKDLPPSVTITPAPPQPSKDRSSRPAEDNQTPAQRQQAAKLALRKQLEKTLLQIPPPKPPPPEMHFIPNPSNTEFIYLVGLEHVVDFLTKESKPQAPIVPFSCSQCNSDFTPVWKWEPVKIKGKAKEHKVICEQCVTTNVKKALKQEHTNRLKTAFVKALQQEQEIEQRLAQNGVFASSSPAPSPVTPEVVAVPKAATPTPASRHAATPPAPPSAQPTPPPARSSHSSKSSRAESSSAAQQAENAFGAAAMHALQRQLLQTLQAGGPNAAHMLQFNPLFYPYQLAMAQAASGKGTPNMADLQRVADIQRQYLLEMIPPPSGGGQRHNWKT
ncbi:transcriptional repressor p66-beta isoform X2 [Atheta coriaria]|uniref:transcriptional repressor p66-beta isoform X2 n=1 Tax=Dalotia coriaria TaxID=877792 RepID=UPI0031F3D12F